MTDEIPEELLSAYLDGELSAEDCARVEASLASSAECRQLLDELRSVRSSMESLPRHKLSADLGPAILRRAERGQFGGSQSPGVVGKITSGTLARDWWSRGGWRRVIWPAAVIAAALLIALFDVDRKPAPKQVAQTRAPQGETFIGARPNVAPAGAKSPDDFADSLDETANEPKREGQALGKLAEKQNVPLTDRKMLRAAQSAAAAPSASAAGNAGIRVESLPREAAVSRDAALTVICDVTVAFVRDRAFEKLLDEQKITYRHGDRLDERDAVAKDRFGQTVKEPVHPSYLVEATPAQVDQIIAFLRKDTSAVSKVAKDDASAKPREKEAKPALATDKPAPVGSNPPGRVRFVLRIVEPQPAGEIEP